MNLRDTLKINRDGHLEIGGADTVALAKEYGTPLYVMDEDYIRGVLGAFRTTLARVYGAGKVIYASKAFCCKEIYRIVQSEGACADFVSGGEIFTALRAGFPLERGYFHGNNKSESEIELAIAKGIGTIVADNEEELEIVARLCEKYGTTQRVMVRVNPGVEAHTHSYIQTAKPDSKFGFSAADGSAEAFIRRIIAMPRLRFGGVHCHIGSQIFDKRAFALAADVMTDFIRKLADGGIRTEELNMGGGFAVHYSGGDPKYNVQEYCNYVETLARAVSAAIAEKGIEKPILSMEPGRSLVAEAGITLYTVGGVKEIKNLKKYLSVDGGMGDNIRPALYGAKYDALLANRALEKTAETVDVAGKYCESSDILISDLRLPKARRGDLLAVFSTGAYCYSMASNYNRNAVPAVVFVRGGESRLAVKRQTYEDLIRNDL